MFYVRHGRNYGFYPKSHLREKAKGYFPHKIEIDLSNLKGINSQVREQNFLFDFLSGQVAPQILNSDNITTDTINSTTTTTDDKEVSKTMDAEQIPEPTENKQEAIQTPAPVEIKPEQAQFKVQENNIAPMSQKTIEAPALIVKTPKVPDNLSVEEDDEGFDDNEDDELDEEDEDFENVEMNPIPEANDKQFVPPPMPAMKTLENSDSKQPQLMVIPPSKDIESKMTENVKKDELFNEILPTAQPKQASFTEEILDFFDLSSDTPETTPQTAEEDYKVLQQNVPEFVPIKEAVVEKAEIPSESISAQNETLPVQIPEKYEEKLVEKVDQKVPDKAVVIEPVQEISIEKVPERIPETANEIPPKIHSNIVNESDNFNATKPVQDFLATEDTKKLFVQEVAKEIVTEKPIVQEIVTEKPIVQEIVTEKPIVQEIITEKPIVQEIITEKPIVQEVVTEKSIVQDIITEKSIVHEIVTEKPIVQEIVTEKPIVQEIVTEKPIVQEIVTEKPIVQEVVTEKSIVQEIVTEKPIVREIVTEKPVVQEIVTKKPIVQEFAQETVTEKPIVQQNINLKEEARNNVKVPEPIQDKPLSSSQEVFDSSEKDNFDQPKYDPLPIMDLSKTTENHQYNSVPIPAPDASQNEDLQLKPRKIFNSDPLLKRFDRGGVGSVVELVNNKLGNSEQVFKSPESDETNKVVEIPVHEEVDEVKKEESGGFFGRALKKLKIFSDDDDSEQHFHKKDDHHHHEHRAESHNHIHSENAQDHSHINHDHSHINHDHSHDHLHTHEPKYSQDVKERQQKPSDVIG